MRALCWSVHLEGRAKGNAWRLIEKGHYRDSHWPEAHPLAGAVGEGTQIRQETLKQSKAEQK